MNKIFIIIFSTPKEYEQELNVRGKNKKEKLVDIFSSFQKTGDELLLSSTQKDIDEFFEAEKTFLVTYNQQLKEACIKARLGTTMPFKCRENTKAVLRIRVVYLGSRIRLFSIPDPGSASKNLGILTQNNGF